MSKDQAIPVGKGTDVYISYEDASGEKTWDGTWMELDTESLRFNQC